MVSRPSSFLDPAELAGEVIEADGIHTYQEAVQTVVRARSHKYARRISIAYPEQEGDFLSQFRVSTMMAVGSYCDPKTHSLLAKVNKYFSSLVQICRTVADIQCKSGWVDAVNRSPYIKSIILRGVCDPEDTKRFCNILNNDGFTDLTDITFVYMEDKTVRDIIAALASKFDRMYNLHLIPVDFSLSITIIAHDLTQRLCFAFAEASESLSRVLGKLRLSTGDLDGMELFFKVVDFSSYSRLSNIDLSACPLSRRGFELFIRSLWPEGVSLATAPPVRVLKLNDTQMSNTGMASMVAVMRRGLYANLEELDVSSNKITRSGMSLLAEVLGEFACPNLKKLNISDNFVQAGNLVELFRTLANGSCALLEEIEFAHTSIDEEDLRVFIEFLNSPFAENLRRINISNNPQITQALEGVFQALQGGTARQMEVLLLEGVSFALKETTQLVGWLLSGFATKVRALVLRSNLMDQECFLLLLQAMIDPRCPRLSVVDFSSNLIGGFDEARWLQLISQDGAEIVIEQVDFAFNPLTDNDMRLLFMFLKRFARIERMDRVSFSANNISGETLSFFFRSLPNGPASLSYLTVDSCSLAGAGEALKEFFRSEACCNLNTLSLRDCGLTKEDLFAMMDGLDCGVCNKLTTLRLDGNGEIDNAFVERFLKTYSRPNVLSTLGRLDLGYTQIDYDGVRKLGEFFKEHPRSSLYAIDLNSIDLHSEERHQLKEYMKEVWSGHVSF